MFIKKDYDFKELKALLPENQGILELVEKNGEQDGFTGLLEDYFVSTPTIEELEEALQKNHYMIILKLNLS